MTPEKTEFQKKAKEMFPSIAGYLYLTTYKDRNGKMIEKYILTSPLSVLNHVRDVKTIKKAVEKLQIEQLNISNKLNKLIFNSLFSKTERKKYSVTFKPVKNDSISASALLKELEIE